MRATRLNAEYFGQINDVNKWIAIIKEISDMYQAFGLLLNYRDCVQCLPTAGSSTEVVLQAPCK
jgi:hypothetical protein